MEMLCDIGLVEMVGEIIVDNAPTHISCPLLSTVNFSASGPSDSLSLSTKDPTFYMPVDHAVPLQKVGRNYRSLRRRGASVHSQLLKNAFEASMTLSSYDSDGDDDDYSMFASNSTLASRDGTEEINSPRKKGRQHHYVDDNSSAGGGGDEALEASFVLAQALQTFGDMGLHNNPSTDKNNVELLVDSSVNVNSSSPPTPTPTRCFEIDGNLQFPTSVQSGPANNDQERLDI
jgi:hypothetical protein